MDRQTDGWMDRMISKYEREWRLAKREKNLDLPIFVIIRQIFSLTMGWSPLRVDSSILICFHYFYLCKRVHVSLQFFVLILMIFNKGAVNLF